MVKRLITIFILMIISIGILSGCGKNNTEDNAKSQTETVDVSENYDPNNWLASLNTTDINGNVITSDIFKKYDLTLVNVWTTWCSACVEEMPAFRGIHEGYKDKGVNIIGVVVELDNSGQQMKEGLSENERELAKEIIEQKGLKYTNIITSKSLLKTQLKDVQAFPTKYFVDKNRKFVGELILSSKSKKAWIKTIEEKLQQVREK